MLGENGLIAQLKKRVVERALAGELTHHLGYAKGEAPEEVDNHRNGYSKKTVLGEDGAMEIEVPRDRSGSFEPLLIAKGQKRFEGFDEKIISERKCEISKRGRQNEGRPTLYTPELANRLADHIAAGLTDEEAAALENISCDLH